MGLDLLDCGMLEVDEGAGVTAPCLLTQELAMDALRQMQVQKKGSVSASGREERAQKLAEEPSGQGQLQHL